MPLDRPPLIDWYRRNRARSRALFDLVDDEAYYTKPIALRHPNVFYEGHLPAFSFNTLVRKALGGASIDPRLEALFARGIDPHEAQAHAGQAAGGPHDGGDNGQTTTTSGSPQRAEALAFAAEADRM